MRERKRGQETCKHCNPQPSAHSPAPKCGLNIYSITVLQYYTQLITEVFVTNMNGLAWWQLQIPEAEIFPIPWRCCFILFLTVSYSELEWSEVVHGVHRWWPAGGRMSCQLSNHWLPRIMNIGSSTEWGEMELQQQQHSFCLLFEIKLSN